MYKIEDIYGKVDKIRNLTLVENGKKFRLMENDEIIDLARTIVDKIEKTKYRTVIISESGATPIANICMKIADSKKLNIKWFPFKTPRQTNVNLYEIIKFYLSSKEQAEIIEIDGKKNKRKEFLKQYCENLKMEDYINNEQTDIEDIFSRNKI